MPIDILMPALSPTMEKGNLAKWLKKEGDAVKPGDVIAEIETDKATMEVEAVDEGVLAKILVPEGTVDVPVNQLIAVMAGEGEDVRAAAAQAGRGAGAPPEPSPPAAPASTGSTAPSGARQNEASSPPVSKVVPSAAVARGERIATNGDGPRVFSSPLARRLARESGIDLSRIAGSGPHGRIVARDVEAARGGGGLKQAAPRPGPTGATAFEAPTDDKIRLLFEPGSYDVVPHDNMRKIVARRLTESKLTIPHFYLTLDCTIDKLIAAREDINAAAPKDRDGKPAYRLSVNDFVIKALALALQKVPDANVTWTENAMLKHRRSDVGVAVAIDGGLITPVVREAEHKSVAVISSEMRDLAARARVRRLKPQEYQGGTTAVSNLGMYGVREFAAVINPPHATILAVGAAEQRAVVLNGAVSVATQMTVTLSTDHRAVDGALGAQLLNAFKSYIEAPVLMVA